MFSLSENVKRIQGSERSQRKTKIPEGAARMDKGEPDFQTPGHIQEAAYEAMKNNWTHYGSAYGDPELREAICFDLHRDYGVERTPDEVLVTSGGIEAINVLSASFLNPGDEVLILNPEYSAYADSVMLFGGIPVLAPLGMDFALDTDVIESKITPRTRMMMMSNPCNPTGKVMKKSELEDLVELSLKHDLLLVVDEVYSKLTYDDNVHHSISQFKEMRNRAVLLSSFSKSYAMTGWRVGYLVASSDMIKAAVTFHKALLICVSTPLQKGCVAAIRGPQNCVEEMRQEYDRRRRTMLKHLKTIEGLDNLASEGAFYFFPRFSHQISSLDLTKYMYDRGILIRSGTEFGSNGEGYFRVAYAATPIADLERGMARMKEAFSEIR